MKSTVETLKETYVKLGGSLNDNYEDIADGAAVNDYVNIPDCLDAINKIITTGTELTATNDNGTITIGVR